MPQLVDIHGNAISSQDLKNKQTDEARLAHLHRQFAEHPSSGLTPAKIARILKEAETGDLVAQCELAEDMEEKDAHIYAELQKRKRCLLGVDWRIKPPRNASEAEKKDAELIQELLEDACCMDDVILDMGDAIHKGFACLEIEWIYEDGLWLPEGIDHKEASWFQTHPDHRDQLMLRDNSLNGSELRPFNWIVHCPKTKSGYVGRAGLVRVLAWPFLFKNYSVRDLAEFLEIYGLPLRLGKYQSGASSAEKATLLRAVLGIGHNAAGIIPKGMEIDFKDAAKGSKDPFEFMINWAEKSESKAILGGTLTSQADGKSSTNALGNVHNEVRQELRDSDLKQIAATLTRDLVYPMYVLNGKSYSGRRRLPKFEFDLTEGEDLKLMSEVLPVFTAQGMRISQQWAHNKMQIPQAKKGEAILGAPAPTVSLKHAIARLKNVSDCDVADSYSEQLGAELAPMLTGFTDEIRQLVEGATSLEDLQQKLNDLDLSIDEASEVLQKALVAAELAGQYEVSQGR